MAGMPLLRDRHLTSSNGRDEFKREVIRTLQERAGNRCSAPDCRKLTTGPNFNPEKATRIGVGAHITAAAYGGPRFDESMTPDERSSIRNGIWLCQNCARMIDVDPKRYSVHRLLSWKHDAEQEANDEVEGRPRQLPADDEEQENGWICPFCKSFVGLENHVCLGCRAEVIRGSTAKERDNAMKVGLLVGALIAFGVFGLMPQWLNSTFGWQVPATFGLGLVALGIGGVLALLSGLGCILFDERLHRRRPPRFFRPTLT